MNKEKLKIVLLADFSGNKDEGMKITANYLLEHLSANHLVKPLNISSCLSKKSLKELRDFKPDIIHYIPGPTIFSFLITKWLKVNCPSTKTVMSATHPGFYGWRGFIYSPTYALTSLLQCLVPLLKPDLLFIQAMDTEKMFKAMGCRTMFLPSGVNIDKFKPISSEIKDRLREKYHLSKDKFTILHSGSAGKWRNLEIFGNLKSENNQVIIVAGTTSKQNNNTLDRLSRAGCLVLKDYLPNIEEVYQLSDCFVFPTIDRRGCIDFPLSILEAMSCNLPVISTRYGALTRVFAPSENFIFFDNLDGLKQIVERLKLQIINASNRSRVTKYSWENITDIVNAGYCEVLGK